jgi:MFS family permease
MAVAVCVSALLLGTVADRLRRRGVKTELVLVSTLGVSMTAQAALLLQWPLPSYLLWGAIAATGAATVLSFAILTEYFPKELSGRANAALNLLHVGCAFVLQSATGLIIEVWPEVHGTYPAEAHQAGMGLSLVLQLAALAWFAWSPRRLPEPTMASAMSRSLRVSNAVAVTAMTPYTSAALAWTQYVELVRKHALGWRLAAAASVMLCIGLAAVLSMVTSRPAVAIHIFEIDRWAHMPADQARLSGDLVDHLPALELARSAERLPWLSAAYCAGIRAATTDGETQSNNTRKQCEIER